MPPLSGAWLEFKTWVDWVISVTSIEQICADPDEHELLLCVAGGAAAVAAAPSSLEAFIGTAIAEKAIEFADTPACELRGGRVHGPFVRLLAAMHVFFNFFHRSTPLILIFYSLRHGARALGLGHSAIATLLRLLIWFDYAVHYFPEARREQARGPLLWANSALAAAGVFVAEAGEMRLARATDGGPLAELVTAVRRHGKLVPDASDEMIVVHLVYCAISFAIGSHLIPEKWIAVACAYGMGAGEERAALEGPNIVLRKLGETAACRESRIRTAAAKALVIPVWDVLRAFPEETCDVPPRRGKEIKNSKNPKPRTVAGDRGCSEQGGPPQRPLELRLAAFLPL